MSGSMLGEDPQATARALQKALEDMTRQLGRVQATVRRGKRIVAAIVISLLLDVAVTIGVGVAVHQARDASAQADATVGDVHAANLAGCRANNIRLARQERVLNGILRTPPHASAASRAYLAHARTQITVGWKPRNCTKAYRLSKP